MPSLSDLAGGLRKFFKTLPLIAGVIGSQMVGEWGGSPINSFTKGYWSDGLKQEVANFTFYNPYTNSFDPSAGKGLKIGTVGLVAYKIIDWLFDG